MTGARPPDDHGVIERLDAGAPAISEEEAAGRAPYERLFARLRDLEDISPPPGWEERTVRRWRAPSRRRLVLALGAAAALAAAAAAVVLHPCSGSTTATPAGLEVAVLTAGGSSRRGEVAVGDVLHARARLDRAHVELRVYQGTRLVVRCPEAPGCRTAGSAIELDVTLAQAGIHHVVVLSSAASIPLPTAGGIERDLLEARDASVAIERRPIAVTQ